MDKFVQEKLVTVIVEANDDYDHSGRDEAAKELLSANKGTDGKPLEKIRLFY